MRGSLGVLREAGIESSEAVHLMRTLVAALIGTLLREVQAGPTFGVTDKVAVASRAADLRNSGLPFVAQAADELARFDREAEYTYATNLAIDLALLRVGQISYS